jgi:hypothetical protein
MSSVLLSAYATVCSHPLSVSTAHNILGPSLKKLQADVRELVPSLEESVSQARQYISTMGLIIELKEVLADSFLPQKKTLKIPTPPR